MNSLEIYCISNHALHYLEDFKYRLAAVGKNKFPDHYIRCDNQNNIFEKEKYYSELTFQYWFWKNKLEKNNSDWIGFCQKRRFWINKESLNQEININNFKDHFLTEVQNEWTNYDAIICNPISVNKAKKIKLLKRGFKSILKDPKLLFDKTKQTLKVHFDMHHGYGNLEKAIKILDKEDQFEFNKFVNFSTSYNPHIMFIARPDIANKWFRALFDWLFRCEDIFGFKNLKGYDTERLYAYLAERYLSYWFNKYTKVLSWPWALFDPYKN